MLQRNNDCGERKGDADKMREHCSQAPINAREIQHLVPSTRPCSRIPFFGISVGFSQQCSRSSMGFVVRNVRFGLFLLEDAPVCTVTAWGAPELAPGRGGVISLPC